jgi:hypothetical protein
MRNTIVFHEDSAVLSVREYCDAIGERLVKLRDPESGAIPVVSRAVVTGTLTVTVLGWSDLVAREARAICRHLVKSRLRKSSQTLPTVIVKKPQQLYAAVPSKMCS